MTGLGTYNAKRRFMRTPEPFGELGVTDPEALRFVVQRHDASRLHYDLRLEIGGVLRSWAVPEGPSLDPADKRLAIATEDHPLTYLEFQGTIPEGEYGAGKILTQDTGTWVPMVDDPVEALEEGELKFRLAGKLFRGGWMLKRFPDGDKQWLLIKERDTGVKKGFTLPKPTSRRRSKLILPGVEAPLPKRLSPQLPSPVDAPPTGDTWLHEIKFDGYRTIAWKIGDKVRFTTRQGLNWTERYQVLVPAFEALDCDGAILDGEIAVQDGRGATGLELLQQALSEGRDHELIFYAFDLVHLNGRDMSDVPLVERKAVLRRLVPADPESRIQFSDHITGDGRKLFAQACRLGLEGVVSKRADAKYRQVRTKNWVKAKRFDVGKFQVVGFTTKSSSRHVASLILAEEVDELTYVGRAGTGLSLEETRRLFEELSAIEIDKAAIPIPKTPNAHFIAPGQYQCEISYRGRTTKNILLQAAIIGVEAADARPKPKRKARLISDQDIASIRLTNPDREMFAGSGTTKLDIALYYARVGELMLPHLLNRPVTLIRCSTGKKKDCFYQRHGFSGLPDGVETMGDSRDEEFLVIRDARGFLNLPQFGVIEFHPWDCTTKDLEHPDRLTIDLDPGEGTTWSTVISGAEAVRDFLAALGMPAFLRTTGSTGVHLVVPLACDNTWEEVRAFMKAMAATLAKDMPKLFTKSVAKPARKGKIYVDVNRTMFGTSSVGSYSLRAKEDFPAALPLLWQELSAAQEPSDFHRKNALFRLEKELADPWAGFDAARVSIGQKMRKAVGLKD